MSLSNILFSFAKTPVGDYIVGTAFESFSNLLPVRKEFENDLVVAFWHPKPFWDKHIVIVPKKKIKNMVSLATDDLAYINEVFVAVKNIIEKLKWKDYSLLVNGGERQEINQIHFHLFSGKEIN